MKIKIKMAVWTAVEGFAWQANSYQPEELRAFKEKMGKFPDRNLGETIPYGGVFVCGDKLVFFREMIAERIDSHGRDALYCVLGSVMLENGRYIDLNKVFQSPEFSKPAANREFPQFMEVDEIEWQDVPRSRREFMQGLDSISSPSDAAHYATYFSKGSFFCWFYGDDKRLSLRVTQKSGDDFKEPKSEIKTPVNKQPHKVENYYPENTNGNIDNKVVFKVLENIVIQLENFNKTIKYLFSIVWGLALSVIMLYIAGICWLVRDLKFKNIIDYIQEHSNVIGVTVIGVFALIILIIGWLKLKKYILYLNKSKQK